MKRLSLPALALLACAAPAAAQQADTALASLVGAERAFSAASRAHGVPAAFLANAADSGLVFTPAPTRALEQYAGRPAPPILLTWYPVAAKISAAGDLGYTTGPFELRPKTAGPPPAYGHYSTVWKRQPDGRWKFLADLGISHPRPARTLPGWTPADAPPSRATDVGSMDAADARASLLEAERALAADAAARGFAEALLARGAEGVRVHRDGAEPAIGADAARALLAREPTATGWTTAHVEAARSGDFGYAHGSFRTERGTGSYMRVWERAADGAWRVVLDVTAPPPPPRPGS
jgi:ketosteroid isomerase-like protein